eukprot:TRINITY_DN6182_c0_g1_i1.p1 TRINITY_DN6182_c0_g1~~TRINITY_DN6182_c0_g1_i1.p1  ORF type:complete len:624 (-),score=96.66 TRINITY_DN6182_c0_g1_i1:165-2036(-)
MKSNEEVTESEMTSQEEIEMEPIAASGPAHEMALARAGSRKAATLVWKGLTLKAPQKTKTLLDSVSGKITGGFWAIMGPSGSGKTSLLNSLACRLDRGMKITGDLKLNGRDYSRTELKSVGGNVMQDDVLNAHLTVYETLMYTSRLRLPPGLSTAEYKERVNDVMDKMGLTHTRDTIVGSPLIKGISGGERKRVCVAMELMTDPQLLFLDEPTSGLDSVSALGLCTRLKLLANSGTCTIICTIHQPQAKIFNVFDNLILLSKGAMVYSGSASAAIKHFQKIGYPCPEHENPADHFMDVISQAVPTGKTSAEYDKVTSAMTVTDEDLKIGLDRPDFASREMIPWRKQFCVLFERSFQEQYRKYDVILVQVLQAILMAVLIGTAFLKVGNFQSSIRPRNAVLFFCCINQGMFGALIVINSFPGERMLILRERMAGTYYASAYFVAKTLAEGVTQLLVPVIFSIIVYFLIGFQHDALKFFVFMFFMILCNFAAVALATTIAAFGRTTDMAVTVLPLVLEVCRLFGGFFLPPAQLPAYFSWLDALSYVKYAYVGVSLNELQGLTYECSEKELVNVNGTATCPITDGEQTIETLGMNFLTIGGCIGVLIGYIIGFRILAFVGIRYIKW